MFFIYSPEYTLRKSQPKLSWPDKTSDLKNYCLVTVYFPAAKSTSIRYLPVTLGPGVLEPGTALSYKIEPSVALVPPYL